jgi:hypothetical protein
VAKSSESRRTCRECGSINDAGTQQCATCGVDLNSPESDRFIDDDPALTHVDIENRVELDRFERLDQAELACGLLRSNNIPCEVSSMPLPGLPADLILWVNANDAKLAWALLADTERQTDRKEDAA